MDKNFLNEVEKYIIDMRRYFHENPEIYLEEKNTSKRIQEELKKIEIDYELLPPSYGIMGTIVGDLPSDKKIVIRADFDALPVTEDTGLEFTSKNIGVMHACGHDAHAAMLLGVAKILQKYKSQLAGTIKLLFQAGEEVGGGINEAIENLEKIGGVDEVIGLHIWSNIPSGQILLKPESIFAGAGEINFKINGKGGHGARPDLVRDPVKAACDLVLHLSSIPSNYHNVLDNAVVTSCKINSGTLRNIFPMTAEVNGTYRYFKPDSNDKLRETINRFAKGLAIVHNVEIVEGELSSDVPPIYNDPEMIFKARKLVEDIEGLEISPQTDPISASDNYGILVKKYKGFYGILGGGKPTEEVFPQHHPKFDIDESSLIKGTEFMAKYAMDFCK